MTRGMDEYKLELMHSYLDKQPIMPPCWRLLFNDRITCFKLKMVRKKIVQVWMDDDILSNEDSLDEAFQCAAKWNEELRRAVRAFQAKPEEYRLEVARD